MKILKIYTERVIAAKNKGGHSFCFVLTQWEKLNRNECIPERYEFISERNEYVPNQYENIPDRYWNSEKPKLPKNLKFFRE